jgi:hypothetical protein
MSYLGGVALLFIVVVGGIFGLYMIINHAPMTAPVDSEGTTVSAAENATRNVVGSASPSILYLAGGVGLIIAVMMLAVTLIYIAASGKSNFKSRY